MYIIEASQASSKLNEFISKISPNDQQSVKNILNDVYLYLKKQGFTYEETDKPHKSPYFGMLTKISKQRLDLDQLSWKLKVSIPLSYGGGKQPVYQFSQDLQAEIKNVARKENGSYILDSTNKDLYNMVAYDTNVMAGFGKHTDGSGVFYDHNNNIVKVILVVKVVVPRVVEDKAQVDTSANHKAIVSKVSQFVLPSDKSTVLKALESAYKSVETSYDGVIESKKVMPKDMTITTGKSYNAVTINCRALVWKTEIKKSTGYMFNATDILKPLTHDDIITTRVDGNSYTVAKVGNDTYLGLCHDYGSRGVEYLYFLIAKPDANMDRDYSQDNPFISSDGTSLKNDKVSLYYDKGRKSITGSDLEDMYNMPRFYTTKKQGLDKAWADLIQKFDANTDFNASMRIIGYDKVRSYCAMD